MSCHGHGLPDVLKLRSKQSRLFKYCVVLSGAFLWLIVFTAALSPVPSEGGEKNTWMHVPILVLAPVLFLRLTDCGIFSLVFLLDVSTSAGRVINATTTRLTHRKMSNFFNGPHFVCLRGPIKNCFKRCFQRLKRLVAKPVNRLCRTQITITGL